MENYKILNDIGSGSYGKIYSAIEISTEKKCVLKEIRINHLSEKELLNARTEVKLLSNLEHPHITQFKNSFDTSDHLFIVMEYCGGGDLQSLITNRKGIHFPENRFLDWFVQLSLAVKYIHDRNILHRDIKAQNIFLTEDGRIKLGDFGISKILDHTQDLAETCVGTPCYLSPEMCENKPYNNKSDIWALGCVLYKMATLRNAFQSNNMKGLILKIIKVNYTPVPSHYSRELRQLIAHMFHKNPALRPSVNGILKRPFLNKRIAKFLTGSAEEEDILSPSCKKICRKKINEKFRHIGVTDPSAKYRHSISSLSAKKNNSAAPNVKKITKSKSVLVKRYTHSPMTSIKSNSKLSDSPKPTHPKLTIRYSTPVRSKSAPRLRNICSKSGEITEDKLKLMLQTSGYENINDGAIGPSPRESDSPVNYLVNDPSGKLVCNFFSKRLDSIRYKKSSISAKSKEPQKTDAKDESIPSKSDNLNAEHLPDDLNHFSKETKDILNISLKNNSLCDSEKDFNHLDDSIEDNVFREKAREKMLDLINQKSEKLVQKVQERREAAYWKEKNLSEPNFTDDQRKSSLGSFIESVPTPRKTVLKSILSDHKIDEIEPSENNDSIEFLLHKPDNNVKKPLVFDKMDNNLKANVPIDDLKLSSNSNKSDEPKFDNFFSNDSIDLAKNSDHIFKNDTDIKEKLNEVFIKHSDSVTFDFNCPSRKQWNTESRDILDILAATKLTDGRLSIESTKSLLSMTNTELEIVTSSSCNKFKEVKSVIDENPSSEVKSDMIIVVNDKEVELETLPEENTLSPASITPLDATYSVHNNKIDLEPIRSTKKKSKMDFFGFMKKYKQSLKLDTTFEAQNESINNETFTLEKNDLDTTGSVKPKSKTGLVRLLKKMTAKSKNPDKNEEILKSEKARVSPEMPIDSDQDINFLGTDKIHDCSRDSGINSVFTYGSTVSIESIKSSKCSYELKVKGISSTKDSCDTDYLSDNSVQNTARLNVYNCENSKDVDNQNCKIVELNDQDIKIGPDNKSVNKDEEINTENNTYVIDHNTSYTSESPDSLNEGNSSQRSFTVNDKNTTFIKAKAGKLVQSILHKAIEEACKEKAIPRKHLFLNLKSWDEINHEKRLRKKSASTSGTSGTKSKLKSFSFRELTRKPNPISSNNLFHSNPNLTEPSNKLQIVNKAVVTKALLNEVECSRNSIMLNNSQDFSLERNITTSTPKGKSKLQGNHNYLKCIDIEKEELEDLEMSNAQNQKNNPSTNMNILTENMNKLSKCDMLTENTNKWSKNKFMMPENINNLPESGWKSHDNRVIRNLNSRLGDIIAQNELMPKPHQKESFRMLINDTEYNEETPDILVDLEKLNNEDDIFGVIEQQRADLEELIGIDLFLEGYKHLRKAHEEGTPRRNALSVVQNILPADKKHLSPRILNIVIAEKAYDI